MTTDIQRSNSDGGTLKGFLKRPDVAAKLAEACQGAMKTDDIVRLTLTAASRNPRIAECTPASVVRALLDAAALGIKPGLNGRGWLIPERNGKIGKWELRFDPGWRGLVDIARRSRQIATLSAQVVYEEDIFEVDYGANTFVHRPNLRRTNDTIIAAYAVAHLRDGSMQLEVLTLRDIEKVRRSSRSQGGPWEGWFSEMARKTAVKRLVKYLPVEPEMEEVLARATSLDESEEASEGSGASTLDEAIMALDNRSAGQLPEPAHDEDGVLADEEQAARIERGEA